MESRLILSPRGEIMVESDHAYFSRRAEQERGLMSAATSPNIAEVHRLLAERYDKLALRYREPGDENGTAAGSAT